MYEKATRVIRTPDCVHLARLALLEVLINRCMCSVLFGALVAFTAMWLLMGLAGHGLEYR